ncbi:hypothetical protein [Paenibacillus sp. PCH8]|uniref:hypothetical protein n=1 Tax=Paenibacillus TaxID=44249 RepID=UPI000CF87CA4|nr:hypothetical protein [Paenibacillus sp. PCH8]PQP82811.1 hypothetical protein C0Q44_15615 [Paenibacillus sp. PCH8]
MDWIKSVITSVIFTGIVVPIGSVFIGWSLANWRADRKEKKDEQIQRLKLLKMLQYELVTTLAYYSENKKYYSKETMTGNLIIDSPLFNVDDHELFMKGVWELLRAYQDLNTAIDSVPNMFSSVQGLHIHNEMNPSAFKPEGAESKFLNQTNQYIDKIMDESTMYIIDAAKPLLEEVNRLISRI